MHVQELISTVKILISGDKGLLAMDESTLTCNKRFAKFGIPETVETRRAYRELILTTPGLNESISGVILYDETIHQSMRDGTPFVKVATNAGMIVGIKVDTGAKAMAGCTHEKITEGLDGLRERLEKYFQMGARFAKWRAVIAIGDGIPSRGCIEANAQGLARYAALCQENGLVPIIEPEVLMDGAHSLKQCFEVTEEVLRTVFNKLYTQGVMLEGMLLKPNMILPGLTSLSQESVDEIADTTVKCLLRTVPAAVPGIMFLSGGQSCELASARLNAMNARFKAQLPWALSFSFARAIQQPALAIWQGKEDNIIATQKALYHRAKCNQAARQGEYNASMEHGLSEKKSCMRSSNRIPVIAGNWKMHKTIEDAARFVKGLVPLIKDAQAKVFIAVPYTAIRFAADAAKGSSIVIGAQNMNDSDDGPFTGEISANMLQNAGAKFVILGHSERRHHFNETNAFIHSKVLKAISENIQIIFCIGETELEHKNKKAEEALKKQLEESLWDISAENMADIILAYEPVWAIGSGDSDPPDKVQEIHRFCRQWVNLKWGKETADKVIIQYGGSVHPNDAKDFMEQPDVDGLLVGGASLTLESFNQIIHY